MRRVVDNFPEEGAVENWVGECSKSGSSSEEVTTEELALRLEVKDLKSMLMIERIKRTLAQKTESARNKRLNEEISLLRNENKRLRLEATLAGSKWTKGT